MHNDLMLLLKKDIMTIRVTMGWSIVIIIAAWLVTTFFVGAMNMLFGVILVYILVIALFSAEENQR